MNRWHLSEAISAAASTAIGKEVRPSKAPIAGAGQTWRDLVPYSVLYAIPGVDYTRTYDGGYPLVGIPYQVTSVGRDEKQTEWMANKLREFLLFDAKSITSDALVADGVVIINCQPTAADGPQEDASGLVSIAERFTFMVSEA